MTTIHFSDQTKEKEAQLAERRTDAALDLMREQGIRQDALQFSKNQLEALSSTIYDVIYSNPRDAFVMLPLNTEVPDGATEYSYRMIEDLGAAKVVADGATDRPMVEVDLTKTTRDIYEFGAAYTYTVGDQARSGAILDFGYVMEKARLTAETIALAHNEYALIGGTGVTGGNSAITGFLNDGNVNVGAASGGDFVVTDDDWTALTGANAYASMTDIIQQVNTQSAGAHSTTDVALSTFTFNTLSGTLLNASTSQTVLSALRQNYPEIAFRRSASLTARGASGVDRIVAWERSAANAEYVASVVYDESTPVSSGFRWTIQARGRAAGTVVRRPLAMCYADITIA
jgi:hypothetical protein